MKRMFINLLLSLSAFFAAHVSEAQNTVGGKVLDSKDREPLTGVSVTVKGTQRGVITGGDGSFSIAVAPDEILQFSYIGYATAEQKAGTQKNMRILLSESVAELEELVVVGYGVQKKLSSVGSISQTKGETLVSAGSGTSMTQALQGILPGVISISATSKPGADASEILIRGRSSWVGDNSPLTLIDGVERDFNDIDPNEVETLSVLKDASATAVYGIKGANGVILVTTKRGSKQKPAINFSANYGLKQPTSKPDYADYITTMNLFNEAARNDKQWNNLIPESTIAAWENAFATGNYGPYNAYFPEIDWWNEMTQTGHEENYNINVNGGSEFMKYFMSLSYFYSGDIFKTQKNDFFDPSFYYRRYNWRGNFDFNITPTSQLSVNLAGKQGYRNQTGYRIGNTNDAEDGYGQSAFFETIYTAARHTFPIKWEDGSYGVQSNGLGNLLNNFDKGQRIYKYYQNFVDIILKQDLKMLTPGLSANAKFSYNATSNTTSRIQRYKGSIFAEGNYIAWYRDYDYSHPLPDGGYALNNEKRWANDVFQGDSQEASYDNIMQGGYEKRLYYELAVNYARSFAGHHVSALALFNRNEIEGLYNYSGTELHFPDKEEAWVGRLTYNWNERYLTELNGSYTGSQKFRRGIRFTFLPSVSVGWRISEEPWLKRYTEKILTNMKIRYSWGVVGYDKSASPFTYFQTYENTGGNGSWKDNGIIRLGSESSTLLTYGPLFREGQTANVNATWETAYKQNLGFEITLIKRLTSTLDFYKEKREGILMTVAVPAWSGMLAADGNVGITKSHGFEWEIGWKDRIGKHFSYKLNGSYTFNENRVVYRNDPVYTPDYQKYAGKPINYRSKLLATGYYTSLDDIFNYATSNNTTMQGLLVPGDLMYVDYNADGRIDDTGDVVPVKYNNYPQQTFSWTLGFAYKGLEFSALFYGVKDVYKDLADALQWSFQQADINNYYAGPNVTDRWTPETAETAALPALHYTGAARSYSMRAGTTYTFKNASYVRLKTMELSYLFHSAFIKTMGISKLQFYVNGNNLLTFTSFDKRTDPEINATALYPLVKRYNFGVRLSF